MRTIPFAVLASIGGATYSLPSRPNIVLLLADVPCTASKPLL